MPLNFKDALRYTEIGMEDIGARIRAARVDRGWTLEELASRSGLSAGFLSQVERDLSTLSIVSLAAICRALSVPIESMVSSSAPIDRRPSLVTPADEQLYIQIGSSPIAYRYLSNQLPDAAVEELLIAEFPAGCNQEHSTHQGEELGYVLEGELVLRLPDAEHQLRTGDSYRIEASQPHGYSTSPGKGARVLMAVTERYIDLAASTTPPRSAPRERKEP